MAESLVSTGIFAAGCLMGAWLTYRRRMSASPIPTLKMPGTHADHEDDDIFEKLDEKKRTNA